MSAFEESGARERDKAWGEMTPVDGGVWARRKLADAYFMACYDRRGLLLTIDSARAAAVASLEKALRWAMAPNPRYQGRHRTEPRCSVFMPADGRCDCGYDALLSSPAREPEGLDVERLTAALRICVAALDGISEMSDATEQSSFREEAWAALEHIGDDLRARLAPERPADEVDG